MKTNEPVYRQFMSRLSQTLDRLQIVVDDEREGWVVLRGSNGHRIAVSRTRTGLPTLETTLSPELLGGPETAEVVPANGRIRCRIRPQVIQREGIPFVEAALELLVDPELPIAPPKKGGADRSVPDLDSLLARVPA